LYLFLKHTRRNYFNLTITSIYSGQTPPRRATLLPRRILEDEVDRVLLDDEEVEVVEEVCGRCVGYTAQALSVPMSIGYHESMKREYCPSTGVLLNSKVEQFQCVRYIVHNALTINNIKVMWISDKTLQLNLLWPTMFQYSSLMCSMYKHPNGNEVFPEDHPVVTLMESSNVAMAGKDGRVRDIVLFHYEEPMEQELVNYTGGGGLQLFEAELTGAGVPPPHTC
jgi:hypothetical protein